MSGVANHLWQSTLFAGAAAMLVFALRRNRAHVRYCVWLAASLKFLVPFSLFVVLGSHVDWTPAARPVLPLVVKQAAAPLPVFFPAAEPATSLWPKVVLAVWACGFAALLLNWLRRWLRVRAAVACATPLGVEMAVPVVSSAELLEPGVFGIFRPVLVLPAGINRQLTREQLAAVLAHELCHVRRRDNLAAALHMLVEAIFWFHPLVWWIGARLVEERERACDEEVLLLGNEPQIYAESILKTCQFYLESPLACVSGVTGSDLKRRIAHIMGGAVACRLNLGKKMLLAGAAVCAVGLPMFLCLAQEQRATFDIISVKPSPAGWRPASPSPNDFELNLGPGGHMTLSNVSLGFLIQWAYRLRDDQISGLPVWAKSRRWHIEGKCDPPVGGDPTKMPYEKRQAYEAQMMLRLQSLLADRFHLKLRQEAKEANVLALVVGKGGPKFAQSPPPGPDGQVKRGSIVSPGHVEVYRGNMDIFARMLSEFSGRMVLDRTGLTGVYDFKLDWAPDLADDAASQAQPGLGTAVREQLGLRLEAVKSSIPVFVVEEASLPEAN